MAAWLSASIADIQVLRASWTTVRGGWGAARSDAAQLLTHRRVMVDTSAMTRDGMQTVLRTRLRLSGDTQTDVLRVWIDSATSDIVERTARGHFQSVAVAMGGFAAALGMERLATRLVMLVGSVASAVATILTLLATEPALWLHTMLTHWLLLSGWVLALIGVAVRWILRLRLRAKFRGGLTAQPVPK